jgi:prepilin-type N-terminal cleavage/methylation domain-containing protein
MLLNNRTHSGFTLIELLVVISIITILVVGATAGYSNFSNKNQLKQTALTLKNDLRLTQTNASSGKKPPVGDCTRLSSYQISFTQNDYTITPVCDPQGAVDTYSVIKSLQSGITIPSPPLSPIQFYVLSKGTNISDTPVSLILSGVAGTYRLDVKDSGDMIDMGFSQH